MAAARDLCAPVVRALLGFVVAGGCAAADATSSNRRVLEGRCAPVMFIAFVAALHIRSK
jgi:hypothetical protein